MTNQKLIINTLREAIKAVSTEDFVTTILYRGEKSHLIRAGRNQISLNVGEEGSKFFFEIQKGKKQINGSLAAQPGSIERVVSYIKNLAAKIELVTEIPHLSKPHKRAEGVIKSEADTGLLDFDTTIAVDFFKNAFERFSDKNIELSGAFSAGYHNFATASTISPNPSYYEGTDFNVELVLQLLNHDKKELRVSQVGSSLKNYNPEKMYNHLTKIFAHKTQTERVDLPPGQYDVVFHADAFSEMISYMTWLALKGDTWNYQTGMLQKGEHDPGKKIFGENFNLVDLQDDPDVLFNRPFGLNGIEKPNFKPIENGVLNGFYHSHKETSDKFNVEVNNCLQVSNLKLLPGKGPGQFEEVVQNSGTPTLYIPYIHYMNFTNPAKGEFTGTSRFGTFLFKDGELKNHVYNLRINDSFHKIFNNIDWLSQKMEHVNLSNTYGLRLAGALACPRYIKVRNVNISGSSGTSKS